MNLFFKPKKKAAEDLKLDGEKMHTSSSSGQWHKIKHPRKLMTLRKSKAYRGKVNLSSSRRRKRPRIRRSVRR